MEKKQSEVQNRALDLKKAILLLLAKSASSHSHTHTHTEFSSILVGVCSVTKLLKNLKIHDVCLETCDSS